MGTSLDAAHFPPARAGHSVSVSKNRQHGRQHLIYISPILFRAILLQFMIGTALFSAACAPVTGYPVDPENTDATLASLQEYFTTSKEKQYQTAAPTNKEALRNEIVLSRMRALNIEFDDFEKNLWTQGNVITTGGDLIALILAGLGATTGSAGTKAALSAATAGIVGARAAINRDLYYERTLPALIAQMEANRAKVQFTILYGLSRSDREYPLYKAEIDLEALKTAGSMPSAVSTITQTSAQDNQSAQRNLATLRTLQFSNSPNTRLMRAWYSASTANQTALQEWMNNDKVDPLLQSIPPEQLIDGTSPEMESDRGRAIRYFDIH